MSTNGDHPSACLALKAAQAGLTEGLLCLRMASSAHGIGALLGKGEFLGGGAGALSGLARGSLLCSQFNIFLPGGLGGGGSGELRVDDGDIGSTREQTILASDGSYQVLRGFEARVENPLLFK